MPYYHSVPISETAENVVDFERATRNRVIDIAVDIPTGCAGRFNIVNSVAMV
jgi:hypothetical protein